MDVMEEAVKVKHLTAVVVFLGTAATTAAAFHLRHPHRGSATQAEVERKVERLEDRIEPRLIRIEDRLEDVWRLVAGEKD